MNSRELILDMLLEISSGGSYSHIVIRNVLEKYNYLSGQEKAFIKRTVQGTLEMRIRLDYVLDRFSRVPAVRMKPLIRELLRMSVYQLLWMDGVPDAAVCNEAVKLAQKRGFHSLKGYVNGVLRNIARNRDQIAYPDREKEPLSFLSVQYSMPEWIVRMWVEDYGQETTKRLLQGLLEVRPITVRGKADDIAGASPHPYLPYAYEVPGINGVANLPGYEQGLFMVQDVSSMLAVEAAGIKPGDTVLDVCAAPGGKALLAAEITGEKGTVIARDLTEAKTELIAQNKARMRRGNLPDNLRIQVWDAAVPDDAMEGRADVVLADLPCSGLGVIGRKPDIKYRVTPESLAEIAALQRGLLNTVWRYVKPGGVLLYSTCTINKKENEEMLDWFAAGRPFHRDSLEPYLPAVLHGGTTAKGSLQLLPGIHRSDGFYIGRLRRDM